MYKYEVKPILCSQLVVRNTHNLDEICITISGDKGEFYVNSIIPKDKINTFLSEDNVVQMELIKSQCFAFSHELDRLRVLDLK